jgi:hypothetical protein
MNGNYFVTPGTHHDLLAKMTHKGVTALKNNRKFKSRITGSRTHCVLPDGTLVDNKTRDSLRGPVELAKVVPKKKRLPSGYLVPGLETDQTDQTEPGTVSTEKCRKYYVNEKLISARVYAYVSAMKIPVLHMVTISFPPLVTEDQAIRYLNTWLTVCRETLHLREYLRVSERQENGTIHFHLMVPQYFNIVKANRAMMVILLSEIRKGVLNWHPKGAKKYNGVDIAKDRKTKKVTNFGEPKKRRNLVSYITKYVSKGRKPKMEGDADNGFSHLAWHNSRGFSSMFTGISLTEAEGKFLGLRNLLNFAKKFVGEFFTWLPWSANNPPDIFTKVLRTANQAIMYNDTPNINLKLKIAA